MANRPHTTVDALANLDLARESLLNFQGKTSDFANPRDPAGRMLDLEVRRANVELAALELGVVTLDDLVKTAQANAQRAAESRAETDRRADEREKERRLIADENDRRARVMEWWQRAYVILTGLLVIAAGISIWLQAKPK